MRHKDDLLCDFAEYYHIVDMEALPVAKLAALSCGLPPESRSMRRIFGGTGLTMDQTLLASICDRLSVLCWMLSKDGQRGANRPKMILQELERQKEKPMAFANADAFMAAREEILRR